MADFPAPFDIEVALGVREGWSILRKFGSNDSVVGTNTREDVWPVATPRVLPTSAGQLTVASSSAEDDPDDGVDAGTGTHTIVVEGLDSNYMEISETIELNGTANVNSAGSDWFRVNRAYCASGGTNGSNVGNITITLDSQTQAYIPAGAGQTQQLQYTVPANKWWLITQYRWHVGRMSGSADCLVTGEIKLFGSNSWRQISHIYTFGPDDWSNDSTLTAIPPKTEVRMVTNSSGATQISGVASGYLIRTSHFKA